MVVMSGDQDSVSDYRHLWRNEREFLLIGIMNDGSHSFVWSGSGIIFTTDRNGLNRRRKLGWKRSKLELKSVRLVERLCADLEICE